MEFFEAALLDALARRRDAEIERGVCLVGPHRDDLELRLGDQTAKGFASHGESWSMALALRLAAYELLRAEGGDPVLLLDDVFAELDSARRRALAGVAASAEQVLVTAAVGDDIPRDWDARRIEIAMRDDDSGRVSVVASMTDVHEDGDGPRRREPVGPPDHLAGLTGMDLVRRTLEEARGAARSQGKNVGRGRTSPTTRRVAGRGRAVVGPGPDVRDPQTLGSGDAGSGANSAAGPRGSPRARCSASGRRWSASRSPRTRLPQRCATGC